MYEKIYLTYIVNMNFVFEKKNEKLNLKNRKHTFLNFLMKIFAFKNEIGLKICD